MKENADYVCGIIAHNLKTFRERQKLSMDQLAALSGVSKSMIGQIERAETNTSVSTLWKIASGLHVPFTSLIEHGQESVMLVGKENVDMMQSEDKLMRLYPYFPVSGDRSFEILYIELDPGASSSSEPHAAGTMEYLIAFGGTLELFVGAQKYEVQPGSAISFAADQPHMYHNSSDKMTTLVNVVVYKD